MAETEIPDWPRGITFEQVRAGFMDHHIKRIEIFREYHNKLRPDEHKSILGAIAGAVFGKEEKEAVIEAGMYVIEQSGKTMKIDVPADFTPRKWLM